MKNVAIKIFNVDNYDKSNQLEDIRKEIQIMAQCNH